MSYIPVTPFRRAADAVILNPEIQSGAEQPLTAANKWDILRELACARRAFDLSDRALSVLQAILSFFPETILEPGARGLVVFPSNKAICERLNGMACSTMRRHLAVLVDSGFLIRRDSPNGKRYRQRYGSEGVAFGFDLTPLLRRSTEIRAEAARLRAMDDRIRRLRTNLTLMRRDLTGLATYGQALKPELCVWDQLSDQAKLTARALRRKLSLVELEALEVELSDALIRAKHDIESVSAEGMSSSHAENEHHHQSSNTEVRMMKEDPDTIENRDAQRAVTAENEDPSIERNKTDGVSNGTVPNIPIAMVLSTCTEFRTYFEGRLRHWRDLVRAADIVRPMMGVSKSVWDDAKRAMGPEEAAVVMVAMLERFGEIRSPSGYLRSLTEKALKGAFSCGPMVMALMRRSAA